MDHALLSPSFSHFSEWKNIENTLEIRNFTKWIWYLAVLINYIIQYIRNFFRFNPQWKKGRRKCQVWKWLTSVGKNTIVQKKNPLETKICFWHPFTPTFQLHLKVRSYLFLFFQLWREQPPLKSPESRKSSPFSTMERLKQQGRGFVKENDFLNFSEHSILSNSF